MRWMLLVALAMGCGEGAGDTDPQADDDCEAFPPLLDADECAYRRCTEMDGPRVLGEYVETSEGDVFECGDDGCCDGEHAAACACGDIDACDAQCSFTF